MADNITINGTTVGGGAVLATRDEGAGVQVQRVKPTHGAGATCTDVSGDDPLPVADADATALLGNLSDAADILVGSVDGTATRSRLTPHTAGGCSAYSVVAAASENGAVVKASAGQLYGWSLTNEGSGWVYAKVYDKATTPTSGDTPVLRLGIPPGGGQVRSVPHGIPFSNGIGVRIVQGISDASVTPPTALTVLANLEYK